ncbi:MAG: transglutaminase domain-containing protein, partial [Syntrophomonas sp.]|nr:transglutaminase domain-containing protein [Syntrophomonas sp.]
ADFRRDQMVLVSYLCLGANLKDSNSTLLQKLVEEDRTVSPLQAESSGLYQPQPGTNQESIIVPAISESNNRFQVSNKDELTLALSAAMMKLKMEFIVDLHEYSGDILPDFESAVNGAIDLINQNTGIKDLLSQWQYSGTSQSLNIKMQYRYSNASLAQELVQNENVRDKVKEIVADIIKPGMTDYDKEKGLHDYIVNNSQYDYKNLLNNTIPKHSYSPYGILVLGRGVCQGYAESFALLCQEAGLECQVVTGEAYSFGQWSSHAWNIVKIDGINYHVDVTFDDPITDNETSVLNHNYFNLTDDQLAEDHKWERSAYPVCSGADI